MLEQFKIDFQYLKEDNQLFILPVPRPIPDTEEDEEDEEDWGRVEHLTANFFKQECIYRENEGSKHGLVQSFRAKVKKTNEGIFYAAKKISELPEPLLTRTKTILEDLRSTGVGILHGEIEDLFIEKSIFKR